MTSTLKWFNLALRALMELGIVIAFGYWGCRTGDEAIEKVLLGIGVPLLGFGFWGLVDFRKAGSLAEPLRLIQELVISVLAAVAWYIAGAQTFGWALGIISLLHHALVYALGQTLLKQNPSS
jgi:hypothetical protein